MKSTVSSSGIKPDWFSERRFIWLHYRILPTKCKPLVVAVIPSEAEESRTGSLDKLEMTDCLPEFVFAVAGSEFLE